MNPNASKNQKLIGQYPFLSNVLSTPMEPYDGKIGTPVTDLTIRVEKADGDLMFRRANNVGLGDSSFFIGLKGSRNNQVMRRGEYLFAVNEEGKIVNRMYWPRNDREEGETGEIYAWSVLWRTKHGHQYSDPIWNEVKYLVWVTVEAWHTDTKKNDDVPGSRFGEFRDRAVRITIYSAPEQGFEKLQMESNLYTNLRLNSRLMIRGAIERNHDILRIDGMLHEMCITFQDEVYFNGMKDLFENGEYRGASGQFGAVKVLCAEMCGYDRVMLEDAASYVTFQLQPGSQNMYVLGQQGTLPQIRNLVRTVVRMWNQEPELRSAFKSDQNVSVM